MDNFFEIRLNMKMEKEKKSVAVGMSGGVDSSVAAYLLKEQGYEVEGFFMKFWSDPTQTDKRTNRCCSIEDFLDAQQVATKLGIRLHTLNFSDKFKENIVDDFISGYDEGITPNPCVRCNQFIKMGGFWRHVANLGFDYIATGHYAKLISDENKIVHIAHAVDTKKDQTYFLYRLDQDTLQHTLFPLAGYVKDEIKEIAHKQGFITAKKKESQELCFLANNGILDFLKRHSRVSDGFIVNIDTNEVLGKHDGLQSYTIGQRKGIGLHGGPWFVVKKHMTSNTLYVTVNPHHELLFFDKIKLKECNWPSGEPIFPIKVEARVRYSQQLKSAELFFEDGCVYLKFDEPTKTITSGQSAVIYKDDLLIGGGVIA